jgi:hypothetical protein
MGTVGVREVHAETGCLWRLESAADRARDRKGSKQRRVSLARNGSVPKETFRIRVVPGHQRNSWNRSKVGHPSIEWMSERRTP